MNSKLSFPCLRTFCGRLALLVLLGLPLREASAQPTAGLVAHWSADGNANDALGNYHGTPENVTYTAGRFGQAFSMNGSNSVVRTALDIQRSTLSNLTMSVWGKPASSGNRRMVLSNDDGGFDRNLIMEGDMWALTTDGGWPGLWNTPFNATVGEWQHLVAICRGTEMVVFRNGVKAIAPFPSGADGQTANRLTIGQTAGPWSEYFHGLIDEVRVYSRALSDDEVMTLYYNGQLPEVPVVVGQPQNQSVGLGTTALISATVAGDPPLSVQWWRSTGPIPNATNTTLTIVDAQIADTDEYWLVAGNASGTATSSVARVVVSRVAAWGKNNSGQCNTPEGLTNVVAVAGGFQHSVALCRDGSVVAWGYNVDGQTNIPPGLSGVVAISAGDWHTLALKSDGTVVAWGWNGYGQLDVPAGLNNVASIAAGANYSIALKSDGSLVHWGETGWGQGNIPTDLTNVTFVAQGEAWWHGVAVRADGRVTCWGLNNYGQTTPPSGLHDAVAAAKGVAYSLALRDSGRVIHWGELENGVHLVPTDLTNAVALAGGGWHCTALREDGTVTAWGANQYGQSQVPVGLQGVTFLAAGQLHTLALVGDGAPFLTTPLLDRSAGQGETVRFYAPASGSWPLGYQWKLNGTSLPGATSPILVLPSVQVAQSGTVTVVVSNSFGTASRSATLTVQAADPDGLIAWWKAEENASDSVGPWHGSPTNVAYASGRSDQAFSLNGTDASIATALDIQPAHHANLTLSVWVKPTAHGWGKNWNRRQVLSADSSLDRSLLLQADQWSVFTGDNCWASSFRADLNVWQHLVVVFRGSQISLYKNGARLDCPFPADPDGRSGNGLMIGNNPGGYDEAFAGLIDDVRVYSRALTDQEVARLFYDGQVITFEDLPNPPARDSVRLLSSANNTGGGSTLNGVTFDAAFTVMGDEYVELWQNNGGMNPWFTPRSGHYGVYNANGADGLALTTDKVLLGAWFARPDFGAGVGGATSITVRALSGAVELASMTMPLTGSQMTWLDTRAFANITGITGYRIQRGASGEGPYGGTHYLMDDLLLAAPQPPVLGGQSNLVTWGWGADGQAIVPEDLQDAVALAAGTAHMVAVTSNGLVKAWGHNGLGQANVPTSLSNVVSVAAGGDHSLALRSDGTVVGWGYNDNGESIPPVSLSNVVAIAAGWYHSLALRSDGTIVCWGRNANGELDSPPGLSNVVAIAAGGYHSLALRRDGIVAAWGRNANGELNQPAGLSNVVAISGGAYHSLALKSDGTVVAWGLASEGQLDVPPGLTDVVVIAAGGWHNLALRRDGTVIAWGADWYGQSTPPFGLTDVAAIAAGYNQSLALKWSGAPWVSVPLTPRLVPFGSNTLFVAHAVGAVPLSYQWQFQGANLPGATLSTLTLTSLTGAESGDYTVIVTNVFGSVTSAPVALTVSDPVIGTQPASLSVNAGQAANLSVAATGTPPLIYQWRKDGMNMAAGTNATLTLPNAQAGDAGHYDVVVGGPYGATTSTVAVLTVNAATVDGFDPVSSGTVFTALPQTDGRIVMGGSFISVNGQTRQRIARLNADGGLDPSFDPGTVSSIVYSLGVQPDGKLVVGGAFTTLAGQPRNYLGRLNRDGSLDESFDPKPSSTTFSLVAWPDGKIVVGGWFTNLAGQARNYLGRLHPDGTLDGSFNPVVDQIVYCLAPQSDGRLVLGGQFTQVGGESHNRLGRVRTDGTVDSTFTGWANANVSCLAVQPDGKILVGGYFTVLSGQPRNYIGRLHPDGTCDLSFQAAAGGVVNTLALQSDGRILIGGQFTSVSGQTRNRIARLNPDGTLDLTFNPNPNGMVYCLSVQADGKIVVGGDFTTLGGQTRQRLARLNNTDPATQTLGHDGSTLTWLRAGAGPEVWSATFDVSADGTEWTPLGTGTRVPGGWQLTGLSLPANARVRARGRVTVSGAPSSASWHVESSLGPAALSAQPVSRTNLAGTVAVFSIVAAGDEPFSYQWYKDGVALANGGRVNGATTPSLMLVNVMGGNRGEYRVAVSNASGCVTSTVATLTVMEPLITTHPADLTNRTGSVATFSVSALGTPPFTYEWHKDGLPLTDSGRISGAQSATLTLNPVSGDDAGIYSAVVSSAFGSAASAGAVLTVIQTQPLTISNFGTNAPTATIIVSNHPATRISTTITASGVPTNLVINNAARGQTFLAPDPGEPRTGWTATKLYLRLRTDVPPGTVFPGAGSNQVTLKFWKWTPAGDGNNVASWNNGTIFNSAPLYSQTNLLPFTNTTDFVNETFLEFNLGQGLYLAKTNAYAFLLAMEGGGSHATRWSIGDPGSYSAGRLLTGTLRDAASFSSMPGQDWDFALAGEPGVADPLIIQQPIGQSVSAGTNVTLSVAAAGTLPLRYQWHRNGVALPGPGDSALLLTDVGGAEAGYYQVVVSNTGGSATSAVALVTVNLALADSLDPVASGTVRTVAAQADGKILVAGGFSSLGNPSHRFLGRLNADGSLDESFNPEANAAVRCFAAQTNGGLLLGGSFTALGGQTRNYLARLEADGTLDPAFDPGANNSVYSLLVQPDGRILVGGLFGMLGGQVRTNLGRLQADGTLDGSFETGANGYVCSLAWQGDGKILVAGNFTVVGGQPHPYLARLLADGTVDPAFDAGLDKRVQAVVVQADGKILVGGDFTLAGGQTCPNLARLNADGTLDTTFCPAPNGTVSSIALQADGCILVAGNFTTIGGQKRDYLARLHADGTPDITFNPGADGTVYSVSVQNDGQILVGGVFSVLQGQSRGGVARLNNTAPATETLSHSHGVLTWQRGGTSPEVWRVLFATTTNGANWISLGEGTRVPGGWTLTNASLPEICTVHARGFVGGGYFNGSGWMVDSVFSLNPLNATNLSWSTGGDALWFGQTQVTYDGVSAAQSGAIGDNQQSTLAAFVEGPGTLTFWWKVSSDYYDMLRFYVGDEERDVISSETDWSQRTVYLGAGPQTLRWVYAKNESASLGQDAGWLDQVSFTPGGTAPIITRQPQNKGTVPGMGFPVGISVEAAGTPPFTYQWRLNGTNLPDATASSLGFPNFQTTNAGTYSVVVSNDSGFVVSSNALLLPSQVATVMGATTPFDLTNIVSVAGGNNNSLALRRDGTVAVWGNFAALTNVPPGVGGVVSAALGNQHVLALKTNGSVFAWGTGYPAVVPPSALENVIQIATTPNHSLALKRDGPILIWGMFNPFLTNVPPNLTNVVSLAGGLNHGLALLADGTVRAWGNNTDGQTNVPPGLTNAVAIAAGDNHCAALRANGSLAIWGYNSLAQSNLLRQVTNAVALSARAQMTLALTADGRWTGSPPLPWPNLSNVVAVTAGSPTLALVGDGPPFLNSPLPDRTIRHGGTTYFYAHATGQWPLHYQWRHNGANLAGATGPWLALTNVQFADAGQYTVVVSNRLGAITNAVPTVLTVLSPPAIMVPPQSQTGVAGRPVTFTVSAAGTAPFAYQWSHNGVALPGATNASLTLPAVQTADAGDYVVVVTNGFGAITSTPPAVLTVVIPPLILTPPESVTVPPGTTVTFSVAATGTPPLTYQWRRNGVGITGATNATLTLTNVQSAQVGEYTVVVGNAGDSVTSAPAILTVLGPPVIVAGPVSQRIMAGAQVSLSVTASGSPPLSYQWQFDGLDLAGETHVVLALSSVQPDRAGHYTVVVSNPVGAVTSAPPATLKVITFAASHGSLPAYQSPGPFILNCQIMHAVDRTLFFIVWQPELPAGWVLVSVSGTGNPQISGGQVVFSGALPNPLNFTCTVQVPADERGPREIRGGALYFLSGMTGTVFEPADPSPLSVDYGALLFLSVAGNDTARLTFLGDAGSTYGLETSTSLESWTDLGTFVAPAGALHTNAPATNSMRFFRARKL